MRKEVIFMKEGFKRWIIKAGIRALWTFAEIFTAYVTVGQAISEVPWAHILSVATVASILCILKSIPGLPELKKPKSDGEIIFGANGQSRVILDTKNVTTNKVTLDVLESDPED